MTSMARQTSATGLPRVIICAAVLSLLMIFTPLEKPSATGTWWVRLIVETLTQSGRISTLIHRGPTSGGQAKDITFALVETLFIILRISNNNQ